MTHIGSSGDFIVEFSNFSVLIEVKNYSSSVPKIEVDKFIRDVEVKDVNAGIFISIG